MLQLFWWKNRYGFGCLFKKIFPPLSNIEGIFNLNVFVQSVMKTDFIEIYRSVSKMPLCFFLLCLRCVESPPITHLCKVIFVFGIEVSFKSWRKFPVEEPFACREGFNTILLILIESIYHFLNYASPNPPSILISGSSIIFLPSLRKWWDFHLISILFSVWMNFDLRKSIVILR